MTATTDRPWMTALEMQFAAARCARRADRAYMRGDATLDANSDLSLVADHEAAVFLPSSQCFAWSAETTNAVWVASQSIPADATFSYDLFPDGLRSCWWWFDWPLPIPLRDRAFQPEDGVDADHIAGLLCAYAPDNKFIVVDFRRVRIGSVVVPVASGFFVVPLGVSLDGMRQGRAITTLDGTISQAPTPRSLILARFVLGACTWLHQRIAVMTSGHIERHRRKQIAREHEVPLPADVKVIQLRRIESDSRPPSAGGESVEWSCRWIVNGHWRNQPYKDERKLIYIMPYVKGPHDMPLKVPTHTVYQVDR